MKLILTNMNERLSQYAEEQFVKFLQNKTLQASIGDMMVFMNITNLDEVVEVCLTMFLANVDVTRLHPSDLNILKSELRSIRAMNINVKYDGDSVPDKVRDTMRHKLREHLAKESYGLAN